MLRIACLVLLCTLAVGLELKSSLKDHWKSFKKVHLKSYPPAEEDRRKEIFRQNVETVLQHNLRADMGEETYKLGINQFADMTEEEIEKNFMGLSTEPSGTEDIEEEELVIEAREDYPTTVDWRDSGYVNPPKNQKGCGSCWAFATTAVVETHYGLAKKQHVDLSEQMLLDCAINGGCEKGGTVSAGLNFITAQGINHASCTPYVARKSSQCSHNATCVGATMTSYKRVKRGDETDMLRVVATMGPVAVYMYANPSQLSLYSGGLYNPESCSETSNHAVVITGYGTEEFQDYWLVRNSWGPTWGEKGHFKIPRNFNKCNIADWGFIPVI